MFKMGKLSTPDWIKEGYDSKAEYEKAKGIKNKKSSGKTFKVKKCPKCGSGKVRVVLGGEEGKGSKGWECEACKWQGKNIEEEELDEEKFLKFIEEKEK